jgi:Fe-S oxidoreductase
VDLARLKAEFLHQHHHARGSSARARFLASAEQIAIWGSRFAPVSNWLAGSTPARWLAERALGLDRRRTPPRFARPSFRKWWRGWQQDSSSPVGDGRPAAALFADTFTNFYEPEILKAVVELASAWGWSLTVPERVCCGRPLISKGFLDEARQQAELVARALAPLAQKGIPIVFCEPSCYSAVRDDHPHLLRGALQERARIVAAACVTFEEWAANADQSGAARLSNTTPARVGSTAPSLDTNQGSDRAALPPTRILLHSHCHQKALVGTAPAMRLLSRIPGCLVTDLDSGCCGMAGSFGYEREHYDVSRAIGERRLLPAVRERPIGSTVVAAGFSCRQQIAHFTGTAPFHPAVLLTLLQADASSAR